jgi:hypothetical protein
MDVDWAEATAAIARRANEYFILNVGCFGRYCRKRVIGKLICCTRRILKWIVGLWMLIKREREQERLRIYKPIIHLPSSSRFLSQDGHHSLRACPVFCLPAFIHAKPPQASLGKAGNSRSDPCPRITIAATDSDGHRHVPTTESLKTGQTGSCVSSHCWTDQPFAPCGVKDWRSNFGGPQHHCCLYSSTQST